MTAFTRLVVVELRKSVDTRASRWLLGVLVALGAGGALLASTGKPSFADFVGSSLLPLPLLLPLVAVLAATGDWSQRAAVTTFALVPRRNRVLLARMCATIGLVLVAALAIAVVSSALFTVLHSEELSTTNWTALGSTLWSVTALAIASSLTGIAMGYLLLNTPLAIAVTVVVPISYDLVIGIRYPTVGEWVSSLAFSQWLAAPQWEWLAKNDLSVGLGPGSTSLLLWTVLPIAVGWWRQLRREVK